VRVERLRASGLVTVVLGGLVLVGCEGDPGLHGVSLLGDDLQAPTVELVLPPAGERVYDQVAVEAHVIDDGSVSQVEFLVDGAASAGVGLTVSDPPWQATWDCRGLLTGPHTLQAAARDSSGKSGLSPMVLVYKVDAGEPPAKDTLRFYDPVGEGEVVWRLPDSLGMFAGYGTRFTTDRPCTLKAFLVKIKRDTSWEGTQVLFDIRSSQGGRPSGQPLFHEEFDGIQMPLRQGTSGWFRFPKHGSLGVAVSGDFYVLVTLAEERTGDTLAVFSDLGIWRNWHGVVLRDGEWREFAAGPRTAYNPLIYAIVEY